MKHIYAASQFADVKRKIRNKFLFQDIFETDFEAKASGVERF